MRSLCARRRQQQALSYFSISTRKIATSIFLSHLAVVSVSGNRFVNPSSLALFCTSPLHLHHHHRQQQRHHQQFLSTSTRLFSTSLGFAKEEDRKDDEEGEEGTDPLRWERMYEQGARSTNAKKKRMVMSSAATSSSSTTATSRRDESSMSAPSERTTICSEVRVVSFDLDNTLWNTGATIGAANDALAQWLDENDVVQPERTEVLMGKFFKANPSRYCPALQEDDGVESSHNTKAPVMLTLLRKDVIQHILEEHNGYSTDQAKQMADEAFETWVNARHAAIDGCMAQEAAETLRDLIDDLKHQRQSTSSSTTTTGPTVVVGAITDGNSDPRKVVRLAPYFDFLIQSEQVGVSKPNPQVYLEAVRHVFKSHPHVFQDAPSSVVVASDDTSALSDEEIEKLIGPWWVHVGDDFVKDVVAAKTLNMRSIWSRELVLSNKNDDDKDKKSSSIITTYSSTTSSTTAVINGSAASPTDDKGQKQGEEEEEEEEEEPVLSVIMPDKQPSQKEEALSPPLPPKSSSSSLLSSSSLQPKEGRQNTIIKMQVGSKDYLANSLQQEFADAVVDRFADIRTVLRDWHLEGIQQSRSDSSKVDLAAVTATTVSSVETAETPSLVSSASQSPPNNVDSASSSSSSATTPVGNAEATTTKTAQKFCIFCGESLPAVANFCSSCGQKQQQQQQ